jgi:quercetin dioxygenase-like cupin family protein
MSPFDDLGTMPPRQIWDNVVVRSVAGERLTLGVIELAADSHVPEHQHENEQLGMVLSGSLVFRIGDESRELGPGGTWSIPANVPHEVHVGAEGAVVVDVFAPARSDWAAIEPSAWQAPRWP